MHSVRTPRRTRPHPPQPAHRQKRRRPPCRSDHRPHPPPRHQPSNLHRRRLRRARNRQRPREPPTRKPPRAPPWQHGRPLPPRPHSCRTRAARSSPNHSEQATTAARLSAAPCRNLRLCATGATPPEPVPPDPPASTRPGHESRPGPRIGARLPPIIAADAQRPDPLCPHGRLNPGRGQLFHMCNGTAPRQSRHPDSSLTNRPPRRRPPGRPTPFPACRRPAPAPAPPPRTTAPPEPASSAPAPRS